MKGATDKLVVWCRPGYARARCHSRFLNTKCSQGIERMGIALLKVVTIYLFLAAIVLWIVKCLTKSKKKILGVALLLLIGPFWRPLLCGLLFKFYGMQPLQEIKQTVESPISVFWQDNVWPGYDENARKWMIGQYLDGVHLKVLALNGDDKRIYLYRAEEQGFLESKKAMAILKQSGEDYSSYIKKNQTHIKRYGKPIEGAGDHINKVLVPARTTAWHEYDRIKKEAIKQVTDQVEIFDFPEKLPTMRYRVDFNILEQCYPASTLLHSDEIVITDVEENTIIAFSRRYMAYGDWLSQFGGANPDFHQAIGDKMPYEFDDKVLFGSIDFHGSRHGRDVSLLERRSKYYLNFRR